MKVDYTKAGRRRVGVVDALWRADHEDAPELFRRELADAVKKLASMASMIGQHYETIGGLNFRRLRLKKTRQWLYYVVDPERGVVDIYSVWGVARGSGPPLP